MRVSRARTLWGWAIIAMGFILLGASIFATDSKLAIRACLGLMVVCGWIAGANVTIGDSDA